jgi:hypothetical protein
MATVTYATQKLREKYENDPDIDSGWLNVYCSSIDSRVDELQHAESTVLEAAKAMAAGSASTSPKPTLDAQGRLEFYSSAFWAMAYSLYDITANAVNTVHPYQAEERRVSFKTLADIATTVVGKGNQRLPNDLAKKIIAANKSRVCRRLIDYRNCSMHRRSVCTKKKSTTEEYSDAYSQIESTGTSGTKVQIFVCDNPLDVRPTFKNSRELTSEINTIRCSVLEQVRQIVSKI